MSSKMDLKIAGMAKAVFQALGSPDEFHLEPFKAAFAAEAHKCGIYQNKQPGYKTSEHIYYNGLFKAMMGHIKRRIKHQALKKARRQELQQRKAVVVSKPGQQLRLF